MIFSWDFQKKNQKEKNAHFSSLVGHRSIAGEGRQSSLLNSGTFLMISLRFPEFPSGLVPPLTETKTNIVSIF
jgi:hypothetical protein